MKVYVKAPAKVNLFLFIKNILPDGFHDLSMLMERVSLFDEIEIETNNLGKTILVADSNFDLGPVEKNLVYRASEIFRKENGIKQGVNIRLNKKIPVEAGLGGGSSDGAGVLRGLNVLFSTGLLPEELAKMGAKIGSDVPFFCFEKSMHVEGKGEKVHEVLLPKLSILLIKPSFSLSTKIVYSKFDELLSKNKISSSKFDKLTDIINNDNGSLKNFNLEKILEFLYNDLEPAAISICPQIEVIKKEILNAGAVGVLMSGSGSCVFGVFKDTNDCVKAMRKMEKDYLVWAVETISPHFEKPVRED